jgi:hypothetical protein
VSNDATISLGEFVQRLAAPSSSELHELQPLLPAGNEVKAATSRFSPAGDNRTTWSFGQLRASPETTLSTSGAGRISNSPSNRSTPASSGRPRAICSATRATTPRTGAFGGNLRRVG